MLDFRPQSGAEVFNPDRKAPEGVELTVNRETKLSPDLDIVGVDQTQNSSGSEAVIVQPQPEAATAQSKDAEPAKMTAQEAVAKFIDLLNIPPKKVTENAAEMMETVLDLPQQVTTDGQAGETGAELQLK